MFLFSLLAALLAEVGQLAEQDDHEADPEAGLATKLAVEKRRMERVESQMKPPQVLQAVTMKPKLPRLEVEEDSVSFEFDQIKCFILTTIFRRTYVYAKPK